MKEIEAARSLFSLDNMSFVMVKEQLMDALSAAAQERGCKVVELMFTVRR